MFSIRAVAEDCIYSATINPNAPDLEEAEDIRLTPVDKRAWRDARRETRDTREEKEEVASGFFSRVSLLASRVSLLASPALLPAVL